MTGIQLAEKGLVPDFLVRWGIRNRLRSTLRQVSEATPELDKQKKEKWIRTLKESPIALVPERANEQHYELPPAFFVKVLGKRLKYSSAFWPDEVDDLDSAEEAMLQLTCGRAEIVDGMDILELGCGWGSLSLWMAQNFPGSKILAVSNSNDQRKFIEGQIKVQGLTNLQVQTADMNDFLPEQKFDRVISIEMFEHMRNYEVLISRISDWLKPGGKLFVHIFTHKSIAYPYIDRGPEDWMTRHFFEGGQMPSADLLPQFGKDFLKLEEQWMVNGEHYQKTCRAWLNLMDSREESIMPIMADTYGETESRIWFHRWRLFFMACEELFAFKNGTEWFVSHYLFRKIS